MSGGGGIHDALCDDNLAEILARLPSVSLLRCRAVCKTWRRIATDPSVLAAHAARRPIEMITRDFNVPALQLYRTPLRLDASSSPSRDDGPWSHLLGLSGGRTASLRHSLDGLLLLYQDTGLFLVCNPITGQWAHLPALCPHPCFTAATCGFYLHAPSGEYRLLCHCLEQGTRRDCYYILSTAAGAQPRRLAASPPATDYTKYDDAPVAHRGNLHWLQHPEAASTGKILSFDTVSEAFRLTPRPPERRDTTARSLLELDGELAVADMQGVASLDIWAACERGYGYGEVRWTLRHRVVEVPPPSRSRIYDRPVTTTPLMPHALGVVSMGGGAILIGEPYGVDVARLYHLKDKKLIREVCFGDTAPTFVTFKESCVLHAFFDSPRTSRSPADVAYIDRSP